MKYECPICECELEEQESCSIGSDVGEPCFICKNKECLNYDEVVYDSEDISRMKDDERTEAQIEDYLLEQAREGNLE